MDIYKYIDEYGIYSFEEEEFNEIDAVIFSYLSYATLDKIFIDRKKCTMQEAGRIHLGYSKGKDNNIIAVKGGNNILHYIKDTKRYKDCILYNYKYIGNSETQFGVVSIEYQKNKVFVSFEGTNQLFSGWIEDFMLSYQCPTISHELAINYINKKFIFQKKEIILGGHSKGGNLALIAGMYSKRYVKKKITKIYGMDSPGLLEEQLLSEEYQSIKDRYIHIIPNYSIIGVMLKTEKDYVIQSKKKGIIAHDIFNWNIENNHFIRDNLSVFSIESRKQFDEWIKKYNKEDKLEFINNLNEIITNTKINDFLEIKKQHKKILTLLAESKNITNHSKRMIKDLIAILIKSNFSNKKEEIKTIIEKKIKKPKKED